ncbi:pseudouridine synthase [Flavobacteriaceae bacterium]|nr:pseudouridine synthase [Flavobacteriaceae bacterium]
MAHHFLIHKPYGYISQFSSAQKGRKKKMLGDLYQVPEGTMAIGRLDEPSEGLLLLTTDGKESERIRSNKVEKEYHVQVDGIISDEAVMELSKGVFISTEGGLYKTKVCPVSKIAEPTILPHRAKKIRDDRHGPTTWVSITLREGKFRQVRKMCAAVNFPVLRLIRVRVGKMYLNTIPEEGILEVQTLLV